MKDEDYFDLKRLSASGCRKIAKNPGRFPLEVENTPAMAFGSLVHCLILEPGEVENRFSVLPEGLDRRTKAGKEFFEAVENSGLIPVKSADYDTACKIKEAVENHDFGGKKIGELIDSAVKEKAFFWESFETPCKAKMDIILPKLGLILDLKTCADASERAFINSIYGDDGYWIQSEFYRLPEQFKDYKFVFVCVEKEPPFSTAVYFVDDEIRESAQKKIAEFAEIYKNGMETGIWESQYNKSSVLSAPGWFMKGSIEI